MKRGRLAFFLWVYQFGIFQYQNQLSAKNRSMINIEYASDPCSPAETTNILKKINEYKEINKTLTFPKKINKKTLARKAFMEKQKDEDKQTNNFANIISKLRTDNIVREFTRKLKMGLNTYPNHIQENQFFTLGQKMHDQEEFYWEKKQGSSSQKLQCDLFFFSIKIILETLLTIALTFLISLQIAFTQINSLGLSTAILSAVSFLFITSQIIYIIILLQRKGVPILRILKMWVKYQNKYWDIALNGSLILHLIGVEYIIYIMIIFLFKKIIIHTQNIKKVENYFIVNSTIQRYYDLIKILMLNYAIGHTLSIILNLIAKIHVDGQSNWYACKGIEQSEWYQKYAWGYYWGTNIMLTVGFGDINANNYVQAILLIFIQTFACIILTYNISQVSKILSNMGQMDQEKHRKIKIINQMGKRSNMCKEFMQDIQSQIQKSIEQKYEENFHQEKAIINELPSQLQSQVKRQINKSIFISASFFKNLTKKTQLLLAQRFQKIVTHPEEILLKAEDNWKIYVLRSGQIGLTYKKGSSSLNGTIIEHYKLKDVNEPLLLSMKFIKRQRINSDLKSLTFSVISTMSTQTLQSVLKEYDEPMFEYYCFLRDKTQLHLFQNQLFVCPLCQEAKHDKTECPKMHLSPFRQLVIQKKKFSKAHCNQIRKSGFIRPGNGTFVTLKEKISIKRQTMTCKRDSIILPSFSVINTDLLQIGKKLDKCQLALDETLRILRQETDHIETNADKVYNYRRYFPMFNAENLKQFLLTSQPTHIQKIQAEKTKTMKTHKYLFSATFNQTKLNWPV